MTERLSVSPTLKAVSDAVLIERSQEAARERGYLWHEFGDVHLILP